MLGLQVVQFLILSTKINFYSQIREYFDVSVKAKAFAHYGVKVINRVRFSIH